MKKTTTKLAALIFIITSFNIVSAQTYSGAFYEMFFGREPSARAEAMGKHLSTVPGDALSYYYNPAGIAALQGLNLNASFAGPYFTRGNQKLDNSNYNFFGASYNIKEYGTVGLSRDYFTFGYDDEIIITNEFGEVTGSQDYDPDNTVYRLTLSSEVIKDLYVGANFNLLHPDFGLSELTVGNEKGADNKDIFYFDLGVIKSFNFKSKKLNHYVNLGTSLINVNSASYSIVDAAQEDDLPVIFRLGASYDMSIDDKSIARELVSYNFLVNAEYEDLFNSKYYGGFHAGFEFTFLEILSLRAGFYSQENLGLTYKYDSTSGIITSVTNEENDIGEFTYGIGLNIPVRQLTKGKTPLEIKFDYANLEQPSYVSDKESPGRYYVYNIIFNWVF